MYFKDRADAGRQLCSLLKSYTDVILYALPRGGVLVAQPIAQQLHTPIHLLITRKIGHPAQPEWALAAVSESGCLVQDPHLFDYVSKEWLERAKIQEMQEIQRRKQLYQPDAKPLDLQGKTVLIVDDGVATGLTLEAGILEIKSRHPGRLIVAVPVAPREIATRLQQLVDAFIAVEIPREYRGAVGAYYAQFPQVTDSEVIEAMHLTY